jgi:hypothetical protein
LSFISNLVFLFEHTETAARSSPHATTVKRAARVACEDVSVKMVLTPSNLLADGQIASYDSGLWHIGQQLDRG